MLELLALAIYMECRGCTTYVDKVAVGQVVMNRVDDRDGEFRYRNTIEAVLSQPGHFPWWDDRPRSMSFSNPIDEDSWTDAMSIARMLKDGYINDPTNGAMWFHGSHVNYSWSESLHPVDIGSQVHQFWRE